MSDPRQLGQRARELWQIGVQAADPAVAVHRSLDREPLEGPAHVLAVGKAACAMMAAALERTDPKSALIVTSYENARDVAGAEVIGAGHPRPDEAGLAAGRSVKALVESLGEGDQLLLLLSGGGSALLPCPIEGVSLSDKQATNDLMLGAGLPIQEVNLVRQNLSQLKGGGLAALAAPAQVRALILSDVIGDNLRAIASGPTAEPLGHAAEARAILQGAGLWDKVPAAVRETLQQSPKPTQQSAADNQLIGSNPQSLEAMAAASGGKVMSYALCGDVEDAAQQIAKDIRENSAPILIWGGETTVTLKGSGKGGRNQELSLRVLRHLQDEPSPWAFLSAGSDGIDGPTDAAGGVVISDIAWCPALDEALANNDAYTALKALDALHVPGATGTNVADFQICIRSS